jgi:hypothetical protein
VEASPYQKFREWLLRTAAYCSEAQPLIDGAVRESLESEPLQPEQSDSRVQRIDSNWVTQSALGIDIAATTAETPEWLQEAASFPHEPDEEKDCGLPPIWEGEEGDGRGRGVLAYYKSIHRFGDNWGIYFKRAPMTRYASKFVSWADAEAKHLGIDLSVCRLELVRLMFAGVYHHEHFHYEVEMHASKAEAASVEVDHGVVSPRYLPYKDNYYLPQRKEQGGADEEALANAQRCRKMGVQIVRSVREGSPPSTVYIPMLHHRWMSETIPKEGPGYDRGWDLYRHGYNQAVRDLWKVVDNGTVIPKGFRTSWKPPLPPVYLVD